MSCPQGLSPSWARAVLHLSIVSKSFFLKKEGFWSVLSVGSSLGGTGMMKALSTTLFLATLKGSVPFPSPL